MSGGYSEAGLDPVKSFLRVRGFAFSPLCVFKCEGLGSPKSLYQVDFDLHLITLMTFGHNTNPSLAVYDQCDHESGTGGVRSSQCSARWIRASE